MIIMEKEFAKEEYVKISSVKTMSKNINNVDSVDYSLKLYQLQGVKNQSKCNIKFIGHPSNRMTNHKEHTVLNHDYDDDHIMVINTNFVYENDINNNDILNNNNLITLHLVKKIDNQEIMKISLFFCYDKIDNIQNDNITDGKFGFLYTGKYGSFLLNDDVEHYMGNDKIIESIVDKIEMCKLFELSYEGK